MEIIERTPYLRKGVVCSSSWIWISQDSQAAWLESPHVRCNLCEQWKKHPVLQTGCVSSLKRFYRNPFLWRRRQTQLFWPYRHRRERRPAISSAWAACSCGWPVPSGGIGRTPAARQPRWSRCGRPRPTGTRWPLRIGSLPLLCAFISLVVSRGLPDWWV